MMGPDEHRFRHRTLVDSSAYFAIVETRDANHGEAKVIANGLGRQRWRIVTTNFVVAEAHALILNRRGHSLAARFLAEMDQSKGTMIVRARASDEQQARQIIARYSDKDFSLTDAISFAVMDRLGIGFAFTFDQHFSQYGLRVLAPRMF